VDKRGPRSNNLGPFYVLTPLSFREAAKVFSVNRGTRLYAPLNYPLLYAPAEISFREPHRSRQLDE
jgi:hypothetical protein